MTGKQAGTSLGPEDMCLQPWTCVPGAGLGRGSKNQPWLSEAVFRGLEETLSFVQVTHGHA